MSAYYCRMTALKRISGLKIEINQTDKPDEKKINEFINWAINNKHIENRKDIDLNICTSK